MSVQVAESAGSPAQGDEPTLVIDDLVAGYLPGVDILNGVSISVRKHELAVIVGPNGAGKSTLIRAIFGLVPCRRGSVSLEGGDVTGLTPHAITRLGMSYVPQVENVFPSLTVRENLEMGAIDQATVPERIDELTDLFPILRKRERQRAGTMSGGERQMVAIAKALMPGPRVLLLDEPSAGLSPAMVDVVFGRVREINESGVTVVMVEQNARRALAMADRGYVLDLGRNRFEGTGQELLADGEVAELYLGGARAR